MIKVSLKYLHKSIHCIPRLLKPYDSFVWEADWNFRHSVSLLCMFVREVAIFDFIPNQSFKSDLFNSSFDPVHKPVWMILSSVRLIRFLSLTHQLDDLFSQVTAEWRGRISVKNGLFITLKSWMSRFPVSKSQQYLPKFRSGLQILSSQNWQI